MFRKIFGFLSFSFIVCSLTAKEPCIQNLSPLIPREVLFGNPEKTMPQISPNGKHLAYIAPVSGVLNVWIKTIGQNDEHAVSKDSNRGIIAYCWTYNNRYLLYIQDKNGDENWHIYRVDLETEKTIDLTPFDGIQAYPNGVSKDFPDEILIAMNKENPQLFDVYKLNVSTGTIELREKNPGNIVAWIVDDYLVVRGARIANPDGGASLMLRASKKDEWKIALTWDFEDVMNSNVIGISHDGKKLYLIDSFESNTARLTEFDCATGSRTILAQDPIYDVFNIISDLDKKPLAVCMQKERFSWSALDSKFAPVLEAMLRVDDGDLFVSSASVDLRFWILGFIHDNQSQKFYLFDKETKTAELLFVSCPELNKYQLSSVEPISFTSRDGLKIHGYLTCPLGMPRENMPLVLYVHGGPWFRDAWTTDPVVQLFANRGYACLQVNFRGSTGYGKEFLNAGNREWGGKMHDDLIDAVDWAIAQVIADPKKIAIYGASYGGYAALVGATFTPDVFCCAVDIVGPSNLVSFLASVPPYWTIFKKQFDLRLGDQEKDVEFLKSRSPLFKVDNIKIPMLIAQGANDPRVNQAESEQIVQAMKSKGLPYEYVLFPDEGHGFAKPENRLKFFAIAEEFLAKHLGGRCEG
ncbi:MAG: Peptidase S9 prolyl oligopeptidase active site domain protein [candidate division TM6 bacterium GW2011_GWF2_37_49]|nr:MAG: Peptidase S9 prolyl oligopeptidase active site domain protein [candidate division TM6 bacterium GW2011_GWF2_37_49]